MKYNSVNRADVHMMVEGFQWQLWRDFTIYKARNWNFFVFFLTINISSLLIDWIWKILRVSLYKMLKPIKGKMKGIIFAFIYQKKRSELKASDKLSKRLKRVLPFCRPHYFFKTTSYRENDAVVQNRYATYRCVARFTLWRTVLLG